MTIKVNSAGRTKANSLIGAGDVDTTSDWSFSADDGNAILGDPPDWKAYAKWFLAIDTEADPETKEAYKYPFGKDGKVYRKALTAIRQRAGQQNETDIFDAAGVLLDKIDAAASRNMADMESDRPVSAKPERRHFVVDEIRVASDGGAPKIVGHAAVFNRDSEFMGFVERVAPGAFRSSINQDDVRALFNHDSNYVLGRNRAGTLRMTEDEIGLRVEIDPPETQWAQDLMKSMVRGDINQMSFGFFTKRDSWDYSGDVAVRTLQEVELFDVSPVTFPAYPDTDVAVRSMEKWKTEHAAPEFDPTDLEMKRKELDLLGIS